MNTKYGSNLFLALLIILGLIGLGLTGIGFTGMVVMDDYVKQICELDEDCKTSEVCCLFYMEDSGVCNKQEMCSTITSITKNEQEQKTIFGFGGATVSTQETLKKSYLIQALLGLLILIVTAILIHQFVLHHHHYLIEGHKKKHKT